MRVAAIVEQCWHTVPGGTAVATVETARALSQLAGVDVIGVAGRHRRGQQPLVSPRIDVRQLHLPRPLLYEAWHRIGWPAVEPAVGEVDVVWASAMVAPPRRSPMVATVHDVAFLDHPEWSSKRGQSFFPRAFEIVAERADRVVCPSHQAADDCVRHGIDPDIVRVIPWGVEVVHPTEAEIAEVRSRLDLPDRFVVWVGTVEPRKNLETLVRAMADVDADLVVVGPEGWVTERDVFSPLGRRVHQLGRVDDGTRNAVIAAADILAMPSWVEGFGLPVLEAMALGTAVVTSRGTAPAELASGVGWAAPAGDPAAWSEILNEVLADDDGRRLAERIGMERAANFTWADTARSYRDVFADAAA